MQYPYTPAPLDALIMTQACVGATLAATLWSRGMRPRWSSALLVAAIAIAVIAPVSCAPYPQQHLLRALGAVLGNHFAKDALKVAAAAASLSAVLTRRRPLVLVAVVGQALLWPITDYVQECDPELAAAHMALFGLLVGVHLRTLPDAPVEARDREAAGSPGALASSDTATAAWRDDVVAFALATLVGVASCWLLLGGWRGSADEWAYTYQGALFAKLHAYGAVPACPESFRSYLLFQYQGRTFAEYTPGWPGFMAPFVAVGAPWLAGPVSLGLLAAGVCRLGRSVASTSPDFDGRAVRACGRVAAAAVALSTMAIVNGGSRYPHVFVAACFAWSVQALLAMSASGASQRAQRWWGALLGASAALTFSTRPADGATLGVGLALYAARALAHRRIGWGGLGAAAATFSVLGAATLVILRLQLGRWLTTGYSLGPTYIPWANFGWSVPPPNLFKWGVPIAAGSYCWWPCSPAVGIAGLASLRGRPRGIGMLFFSSILALTVLYTLAEFGRRFDWGYGPRYQLPYLVPMAVGTGLVLARLWVGAVARPVAPSAAGAAGIAFAVVPLCLALVAPPICAYARKGVLAYNVRRAAAAPLGLHHAIIFGQRTADTSIFDIPESLPAELYPEPDVLWAIDLGPDANRCVVDRYPGWSFYRTVMGSPVRIVPYEAP